MEFALKTLSPDALPRALEKAVRYRLLNEPGEAASICLDVLAADADNQDAAATLLLALTDQFELEEGLPPSPKRGSASPGFRTSTASSTTAASSGSAARGPACAAERRMPGSARTNGCARR